MLKKPAATTTAPPPAVAQQPVAALPDTDTLVNPSSTRDTHAALAASTESRSPRQKEVDDLINQALTAPQMGQRTAAALQASSKAVAGLADTLTAIDAAQRVIIDNLRNAGTIGFKSTRAIEGDGRDISLQLDGSQGVLERTDRPLDVAVQGEGYFQVRGTAGKSSAYTRNGNFSINPKGQLVLGEGDGLVVSPPIVIPAGAAEITIAADGKVEAVMPGSAIRKPLGQLVLCRFVNPSSLRWIGGSLYAETEAAGTPVECKPGDNGSGQLLQGFLEQSNVDLTRERLRLRFLQNWRETILRAIDGEPRQ